MIETPRQFEAALQQVAAYLAEPPQEGTAQDADFARLLSELKEYRKTLPPAEERKAVTAFSALDEHLAEFRARYPEHHRRGELSHFGFGQDLRGGD
jgi:hypothetical protein